MTGSKLIAEPCQNLRRAQGFRSVGVSLGTITYWGVSRECGNLLYMGVVGIIFPLSRLTSRIMGIGGLWGSTPPLPDVA